MCDRGQDNFMGDSVSKFWGMLSALGTRALRSVWKNSRASNKKISFFSKIVEIETFNLMKNETFYRSRIVKKLC